MTMHTDYKTTVKCVSLTLLADERVHAEICVTKMCKC